MPGIVDEYLAALFVNLDNQEITLISQYAVKKTYDKGAIILRQGSAGGELYCIESGQVEAKVILPGDYAKTAMTLLPGELFGEIAFLGKHKIAASLIAMDTVVCIILPAKLLVMLHIAFPQTAYKFEQTIANYVIKKSIIHFYRVQTLLQKLASQAKMPPSHSQLLPNSCAKKNKLTSLLDTSALSKIPFFSAFSADELTTLLAFTEVYRTDKGYRFGSPDVPPTINIICSGAVMFFIKNNTALLRTLAVYGVGKLFMTNPIELHDLAEYVSCENSVIVQISMDTYKQLQVLQPAIFYTVSRFIHENSVENLYILNREFVRLNSEYSDLLS